jgi:beta-galactosidase
MLRTPFNAGWTVTPKQSLFAAALMPTTPVAVTLPHDAMRDLPRSATSPNGSHSGYYPSAHVVYEKSFDASAEWAGKTVVVQFDGVYRDAVVYLNGDFLEQRPSGYSPFSVDLTSRIVAAATNVLRVEARTHQDSRWYTGVGIHRDVWLGVADAVHIPLDGVTVTTPQIATDLAIADAAVELRNESRQQQTVRLQTRVLDARGLTVSEKTVPVTLLPGEPATARIPHYLREPELWNTESPHLYRIETVVLGESDRELDRDVTTFGVRSITVDPFHGLRVNGRSVNLRGGCIHHDNGPLGAAAIVGAERRRIALLKAAGFNAIRSAHNPAGRALLDACDELGMLVVDELSDVWTVGKSSYDTSLSFPEWWERDVESLVRNDRNHPSVVLYSIGNEILEVGRPGAAIWGRRLVEKIRELDPTRPVTNAVNALVSMIDSRVTARDESVAIDFNSILSADGSAGIGASATATRLTEETHAQVDVAGINYSEARYDLDAEIFPDRVLLGTETFPGKLDHLWALVEKHPQVIGDFVWTAWDHLGEAGTIDINGVRRPISYWRETVWGLRDEPYIAVHRPQGHGRPLRVGRWAWDDVLSSWAWDVEEGSPIVVDVYTDADEVELLLNGETVGTQSVGIEVDGRPRRFIARFQTEYRRGALTAIPRTRRKTGATSELRSLDGEITLHATAEDERVGSTPNDLAFLHLSLRDEAGTLAVDAGAKVEVSVEGPGELLALSSARPDDAAGFGGFAHATHEGRLLAVVRPTGTGRIRLTAMCPFGSASVDVIAE